MILDRKTRDEWGQVPSLNQPLFHRPLTVLRYWVQMSLPRHALIRSLEWTTPTFLPIVIAQTTAKDFLLSFVTAAFKLYIGTSLLLANWAFDPAKNSWLSRILPQNGRRESLLKSMVIQLDPNMIRFIEFCSKKWANPLWLRVLSHCWGEKSFLSWLTHEHQKSRLRSMQYGSRNGYK